MHSDAGGDGEGSRTGALTGTDMEAVEASEKLGRACGRERREGIVAEGAANEGSLALAPASMAGA